MSQHDFNIANQTASATRADLNNALGALASLSSGTTAPATTFANMLWYETDTNWLWVRNEADSAWIRFAYFNQSTNQLALEDNTYVVDTAGTQTGLLGDQATGTWQAGTGTTQSLVSPANVKAAVLALAPSSIPTTEQVGAATAGLTNNTVGSYIFARYTTANAGAFVYGSTYAGTSLQATGVQTASTAASSTTTVSPIVGGSQCSGTWRAMGKTSVNSTFDYGATLFLRIS